jgi:hypothetical protein
MHWFSRSDNRKSKMDRDQRFFSSLETGGRSISQMLGFAFLEQANRCFSAPA